MYVHACMHAYTTLPKLGAKRLGGKCIGGETTKGGNRGETSCGVGDVLRAKRLVTIATCCVDLKTYVPLYDFGF